MTYQPPTASTSTRPPGTSSSPIDLMSTIKIYGGSDDLVYIAGEEYSSLDKPTFALFSDGTQVKAHYGEEGVWKVDVIESGTATVTRFLGLPDGSPAKQEHGDKDAPSYSDVVILASDSPLFALVKRGHRKQVPNASVNPLVDDVIKLIEKTPGGESWLYDMGEEDRDIGDEHRQRFRAALVKLLAGKAAPKRVLTFVITGTLSQPRQHFVDLIEAAGHKVAANVTAEASYLVYGEANGDAKMRAAQAHGTTLIGEDNLIALLAKS